jgi:hypothetical protein
MHEGMELCDTLLVNRYLNQRHRAACDVNREAFFPFPESPSTFFPGVVPTMKNRWSKNTIKSLSL